MFSTLIIAYLFLGGIGAGSLMILSIFELFDTTRNKRQCAAHQSERLSKDLYVRCWPLCTCSLLSGAICLLFDIGRVDRIFNLLIYPEATALSVGTYGLFFAILCAVIFTLKSMLDSFVLPLRLSQLLSVAGIVSGAVTAVYASVLMRNIIVVPFWDNILLPVLFFLSSISTGMASIFLGISFGNTRKPKFGLIKKLVRFDMTIIVLEILCLTLYLAITYKNPATESTAQMFLTGDMYLIFWVGLVACGLVLPLILEGCISKNNNLWLIQWISLFVLIGGLILRVAIVEASLFAQSQLPFLALHITM